MPHLTITPGPQHQCTPPRYRPKSEWRTVQPPRAFMRPEDRKRAKSMRIPTEYPAGTLWRCGCGRAWVRRAGQHYGRNPLIGHTEGNWMLVGWWQWRLRRRITAGDFEAMAQDPIRWTQDRIAEMVEASR